MLIQTFKHKPSFLYLYSVTYTSYGILRTCFHIHSLIIPLRLKANYLLVNTAKNAVYQNIYIDTLMIDTCCIDTLINDYIDCFFRVCALNHSCLDKLIVILGEEVSSRTTFNARYL